MSEDFFAGILIGLSIPALIAGCWFFYMAFRPDQPIKRHKGPTMIDYGNHEAD